MPARGSGSGEGVELSTMQSSGQAAKRHARRRTTLADMRSGLQDLESQHPERHYRAKVVLALFTFARIAASLYVATLPDWWLESYGSGTSRAHAICDGTLRPAVSGLGIYMFLHRPHRFSSKNRLHFLSLVTGSTRARSMHFLYTSAPSVGQYHCGC